ncbi:MAG: ECF-type sigma factor [Acidobacteriota bacterium]
MNVVTMEPSPEKPIPYQFTPEGRQILQGAQSLRHRLAAFARAERDGVTSLDSATPGMAGMVSAMRKSGFDILPVDDLLHEFETISDRGCRAFELHFFVGLPPERIAPLMQIPERVASRDVAIAKAWLLERLKQLTSAQP